MKKVVKYRLLNKCYVYHIHRILINFQEIYHGLGRKKVEANLHLSLWSDANVNENRMKKKTVTNCTAHSNYQVISSSSRYALKIDRI